jgi:hypothetical protein
LSYKEVFGRLVGEEPMSQQRETATDRLVSIIQSIQLGRRTGTLTVRRGEGFTQEEGTIAFNKGQVTQTSAGRRTGSEALNWLTTWGNCRFTFVSNDTVENTSPLPPSHPTGEAGSPVRQRLPLPGRQTEPLPTGEPVRTRTGGLSNPILNAPFRTRQIDSALRMIDNMGLSRAHRRLLLLIDGQRSTEELVRLMGRNPAEVYDLLHDLEQATVIQIPLIPPNRQ